MAVGMSVLERAKGESSAITEPFDISTDHPI